MFYRPKTHAVMKMTTSIFIENLKYISVWTGSLITRIQFTTSNKKCHFLPRFDILKENWELSVIQLVWCLDKKWFRVSMLLRTEICAIYGSEARRSGYRSDTTSSDTLHAVGTMPSHTSSQVTFEIGNITINKV